MSFCDFSQSNVWNVCDVFCDLKTSWTVVLVKSHLQTGFVTNKDLEQKCDIDTPGIKQNAACLNNRLYKKELTLNILHHTIPHQLCRFELWGVHIVKREIYFLSFAIRKKLWIQNFQNKIQPFSCQTLREWILKIEIFTTDTGKLRVNEHCKMTCLAMESNS